MATSLDLDEYDAYIQSLRETEYPMLRDSLYLDHAGTTLYSKTLMDRFHTSMLGNMYGNPHSMSPSSQTSTLEIERVRMQALRFLNADPEIYDLVFAANTTAAIKLVMEAFREQENGFWYGYHVDSHTSLVGMRESARDHRCFENDDEVCFWLDRAAGEEQDILRLFAYPAQSNMNGRRLPLDWTSTCRNATSNNLVYTLLDAAAYAATSPLQFHDSCCAPDFTVLSFSKIFGFPDLGALVVRKDTAHLFQRRRYFGGGTVDMVLCLKEQWHALKEGSIHDRLEDGTLPVHNIMALKHAIETHTQQIGAMLRVAEHTAALTKELFEALKKLRHANNEPVVRIYCDKKAMDGDFAAQGPTVAFNLRDSEGQWVSTSEFEKLAVVKDIHLRTGGLCNPGGVASNLKLAPWEMRDNFSAGLRCGGENDIVNGKPTGVIRVSLGAMSTRQDVWRFESFLREFFVDSILPSPSIYAPLVSSDTENDRFYVETVTVYPIKSCAGWEVPPGQRWDICPEGLAWDREWCVVKQGTGVALSQKAHPRMALIRPQLDFERGLIRVQATGLSDEIVLPLSQDPRYYATSDLQNRAATVCDNLIMARVYTLPAIEEFFTKAVGVPCTLARFPATSQGSRSTRHSKLHLQRKSSTPAEPQPILFSNESPILTISRSSLNRLNEIIKTSGGKAVHANAFRANIVVAESPFVPPGQERPWAEDQWFSMRIGDESGPTLDFLGGCRRCQMVCIDQDSGEKKTEPFVTLAKTRRFNHRVLFGVHASLRPGYKYATIKSGDRVQTWG